MTKASADTTAISSHEAAQVERANDSGRIPVVFVHGLWLLPNSWQRWETLFGEAGYATVAPGWPDDPQTVQEAKAHPEVFAHKTVGQVADHVQAVIEGLSQKPAVIGNPANRHRAIPLTFDQFRYSFANAVSEDEAEQLYEDYSVPGSGEPTFQAAAANSIRGPRRRWTRRIPIGGRC